MKRKEINRKANELLKKLYQDKEIMSCEVQEPNCQGSWAMSFHHRHKRVWYYEKPDSMLSEFNQTLLTCASCHGDIEYNKELHEYHFKRLRGDEKI